MKTIYGCEFCSYTDDGREVADEHEKNCLFNPKWKSCKTCGHAIKTNLFVQCSFFWNELSVVNCPKWVEKKREEEKDK